MAAYFQQFDVMSEPSRWVHEVSTVSLENKIDQLTNIVYSLIAGRNKPSRVCGICTMPDHPTDYCPILQGETSEIVFADRTFPGPPQIPYNPYGNTYNPGWKDHPNFSYAQNQKPNQASQQRSFQQHCQQPQKTSLELMIEEVAISQKKMMEKLDASQEKSESRIQELEKQVSKLAQTVGRLESLGVDEANDANLQEEGNATSQKYSTPEPELSPYVVQPHFLKEKEILDFYRKVEIIIPLIEVIRKLPRYAPFLKEFCANKRKFYGHEKVNRGDNIFAVFTRRLTSMLKNQGMFATPRKINRISLKKVLSWTKRKR
ncbi:hypothetical protein GQ457_09G006990 [Hibiscus cannabinus]